MTCIYTHTHNERESEKTENRFNILRLIETRIISNSKPKQWVGPRLWDFCFENPLSFAVCVCGLGHVACAIAQIINDASPFKKSHYLRPNHISLLSFHPRVRAIMTVIGICRPWRVGIVLPRRRKIIKNKMTRERRYVMVARIYAIRDVAGPTSALER